MKAIDWFYGFQMTKLERQRFWKFWKKHPFAGVKMIFPAGAGYIMHAVSFTGKYEEDITDYDYMISHF